MMPYPENPLLLVDDEEPWLHSFALTLRQRGGINHVVKCSDSREVMPLLKRQAVDTVVVDLTMPHISGEELLKQIVHEYPNVPVIVITGMNQLDVAVGCMKAGAFDFFIKTAERERLVAGVKRAIEFNSLKHENQRLRSKMLVASPRHAAFAPIVTDDPSMFKMFDYLEAVAPSCHPVLICGESGTGKELIARAVHQLSRPQQPLVAVNVAGLDDEMFADTLFGHVAGAFTGAKSKRVGMVEQAGFGTLFLDEIGDLSLLSQIKLLRLLQEQEFLPVGSDKIRHSQARIVCATNVDLEEKIRNGRFRADLYYRLSTHQVSVPPLRRRPADLPMLLNYFVDEAADDLDRPRPAVKKELVDLLRSYSFPGNVRELQAMVYDVLSQYRSGALPLDAFREKISDTPSFVSVESFQEMPFPEQLPSLQDMAQLLVAEAMRRAQGNQRTAAALLGISQQALSKRLKKMTSS
ncbi:MAG: two-component system response regulator [Desulfuromonas sp.]|nr:MAG: two-component system response regulator [Desulfuromonas sp.]